VGFVRLSKGQDIFDALGEINVMNIWSEQDWNIEGKFSSTTEYSLDEGLSKRWDRPGFVLLFETQSHSFDGVSYWCVSGQSVKTINKIVNMETVCPWANTTRLRKRFRVLLNPVSCRNHKGSVDWTNWAEIVH
jgi:hypothetical protein